MGTIPPLRELVAPPDEVKQAAFDVNLVLFVGAGVSRLLGLPSWAGLAQRALEDLLKAKLLNYSEIEQLKTLDPKKQLSIATLIAEDNEIDLDIGRHLKAQSDGDNIYKAINDIGCSCVTTNYDELLSPRYYSSKDGSETASPGSRTAERDKLFSNLLNEPGAVVHLHGCISQPRTMVVTTKDYLEHYDNENVQEFLGDMFARKTVVFLGYGLEEAEILEHILRRGGAQPFEVNKIWQEMLNGTAADYPAEAIQQILTNLVAEGVEGVREARSTISIYLSKGVERPAKILDEVLTASAASHQ